MNSIIGVYNIPYNHQDGTGLICENFNLKWGNVKKNPTKDLLDIFALMVQNGIKKYLDLEINIMSLPYGSEEELSFIEEIQKYNGGFNYDFLYYNGPDFQIPSINYFSKDFFIFKVNEEKENQFIVEEVKEINSKKPHIILIKGETIKSYQPTAFAMIYQGIKNKKINNKAQIFFTYNEIINKAYDIKSSTIISKGSLNNDLILSILQFHYSNKPGLIKSFINSLLLPENFSVFNLAHSSKLFQYTMFVNGALKEHNKVINNIIEVLNNRDFENFVGWITRYQIECTRC